MANYQQEQASGFFTPEKRGIEKGIIGGIAMIAIALVWFFAGLQAGYIFFYPPILFLIGVYALLKGLFTGNISGNKNAAIRDEAGTFSYQCPECQMELELDEQEILNGQFTCPSCGAIVRLGKTAESAVLEAR